MMQTETQTVTVNAAFLQEIKDDDVHLKALLSMMLETYTTKAAVDIVPHQLATFLEELRDQVALHFSLEEAFGYFDCPLEVSPRFSENAIMLRKQHGPLYEAIVDLAEAATEIVTDGISWHTRTSKIKKLLAQMRGFHNRMSDHEAAEEVMILEAYNVDIGGEG